jgi:hypothetical protein
MTSSKNEQRAEKRPPYQKPVLRSISLVADQVLSGPCKGYYPNTKGKEANLGCINNLCLTKQGS